MDFEVFSKAELEEICRSSMENMPDSMKESLIKEFGSMDKWEKHYVERASKEDIQKGYQKMISWYGSKATAYEVMKNPPSQEVIKAYGNRVEAILENLVQKKDKPIDSFEVREVIGEYGFVMKQLYQIKHEEELMLAVAASYRDEKVKRVNDERYGVGAAEFFAQAIEAFYKD